MVLFSFPPPPPPAHVPPVSFNNITDVISVRWFAVMTSCRREYTMGEETTTGAEKGGRDETRSCIVIVILLSLLLLSDRR